MPFIGLSPKLNNIYMDKICPARYAEQYRLFQMDVIGNTYHLSSLSTNQITLVTLVELNTFYYLRTNYVGHL